MRADCASLEFDRDPISDLDAIEKELAAYAVDPVYAADAEAATALTERPRLVLLNKIDLPDGAAMAELVRPTLEERGTGSSRPPRCPAGPES